MSQKTASFYPQVESTNPDANSVFSHFSSSSSSSSMYPSITTNNPPNTPQPQPHEHVLVTVPNVILHLIQKDSSVHLASGDLTISSLKEEQKVIAVLARIGDQIQWPLAKDVSTLKLDDSHYFFTLQIPYNDKTDNEAQVLNYGMTVETKGSQKLSILKKLDEVLENYSFFKVEKVKGVKGWEVLEKKEVVEETSAAAYWTTLAPNVEDYSGRFARWIAAGSGQMIRGILFCGDVTVDRLKWGNDFMKKRLQPGSSQSQISPHAMESMKT
jgi:spartin